MARAGTAKDFNLVGIPIYTHTITVSLNDNPSALIPDTTFHLSGTSDYGTDVSLDETTDGTGHLSFKNIEKGTYTLTETKANPDYILNPAEYKVYIDNNGIVKVEDAEQKGENYVLKNEPRYHDFSIRKVDKENTSEWLSGASFRLQGVSELGTAVDKTVTTDDTGLAEFLDVEKGKYILTETKAPANHKLDPKSYTVSVSKFGDVEINGLSKDDNGHFNFPDERSLDGKITITKKWVDTGKSDSDRPVPKVHLTTKEPFYEKQAYAVYDSKDQSMTFFRNNKGKYTDGQVSGTKTYYTGFESITGAAAPSWVNSSGTQKNVIKTVVFKDKIQPKTCYEWFDHASSLSSITGLDKLDTKNVTDMSYMFDGCGFTNLNLSSFNTGKVTDMSGMFYDCDKLTSLDLSNFNTANVTDMASMFYNCDKLTSLDLSNFNTANVTNMHYMFSNCDGLTSLNLSSFNTENVTNMGSMFSNCDGLTSLNLSSFNTANVTNMASMFYNCSSLTSLDVSNFNTANVTDMASMFSSCSNLTSLDLNSFNTGNVTTMHGMFDGCSKLPNLNLSNFNTENVTNMSDMFDNCSKLTSLDLSHFNTENVTNMASMFYNCDKLTSLDLSNFNTANVTNMHYMFSNCDGLTSLNLSSFNTENVTNMGSMFNYCSGLTSLNLSSFNTANVTNMASMFYNCSSLTSLDLSHFNTENVTNMAYMFCGCKFTSLDLSSFNTANVTKMWNMFYICDKLKTIYVSSSFTLNANLNSSAMFGGCYSLVGGAGTTFDYNKPHDATYARIDGGASNPGYFTAKAASAKAAPAAAKANLLSASLASVNALLQASETGNLTTKSQEVNTSGSSAAPAKRTVLRAAANANGSVTKYSHTPNISDSGTLNGNYGDNLSTNDVVTIPGASKLHVKITYGGESASWDWVSVWQGAHSNYKAENDYSKAISGAQKLGGGSHTSSSNTKEFDVDGDSVTFGFKSDGSGYGDGYGYYAVVTGTPSQAYAVYDSTDQSMTFFRDAKGKYTDGQVDGTKTYYTGFENIKGETDPSWVDQWGAQKNSIKTVVFKDKIQPKTCYEWFRHADFLTSITGLDKLDTGNVTNMSSMFSMCSSLTSLDVSSFNTGNVTDMDHMFGDCSSLISLDVSSFNTAKVTDMSYMFGACNKLNTLVLGSAFTKTSSVTSLAGNWNRVATTSGRKVAKTAAISADTLMSTYDGSTMSGIWQKEGTPESASPIDIYEDYVSDDSKWTKNGDGTWTYTFDVYDDTAKFYAYEEKLSGYTSSNDEDNQLVINDGTVTKSGTITNTESDYGSLKLSKTVAGDNLDTNDKTKKFNFTVRLSGANISGTQEFGGVVFTDGTAAIALADGEEKTFTNIPEGTTYTVTETPNAEYTEAIAGSTGTIASGKTAEANAVNTKVIDKNKLADLAVSKKTEGTAASDSDSFNFKAEFTGLVPGRTYSLVKTDNASKTFTADILGNVTVSFDMTSGVTETFKDLPVGAKYRITEEKNSYTPAFTITNADDSGAIKQSGGSETAGKNLSTAFETVDQGEKSTVLFTNTKNKDTSDTRDLVLIKKASDSSGKATDIALPGAWFNLKGTSDNGEDIDISKKSDSNGRIVFDKLYAGTYTLTEKQAPNGYQKDDTKRTVTVDPEKDPAVTVTGLTQSTDNTFPVYNKPVLTYAIGFLKNDSSGEPVKDAELALFDSDGNRVAKWTTGSDMHTESLAEGVYTLKETLVPDGYTKADDITFTVGSGGIVTSTSSDTVQKLTVTNTGDPAYAIKMIDPSSISGLPLTGGMGTKLLYILGAAFIIAGITLYLKKKKGGK